MTSERKDKRTRGIPHTIADHALGALVQHVHAPGYEHDHDHDHDGMDLMPGGEGDHVALTSIGIDIGSSGTQVALARLILEAPPTPPTPAEPPAADAPRPDEVARLTARRRETIYQSPIYLTPFASPDRIDEVQLGRLIDHALEQASVTADDIDCGVVILTGAARERRNADAIATTLAERCGDIVSAAAGHHMEARLAAHGSGAVARSAEFGQRFLNVDIGGATTKLAICENGTVVASAALAIGGRLVATDREDRIVRLEPWGKAHADAAGLVWEIEGTADWAGRQQAARHMADLLIRTLGGRLGPASAQQIWLTEPLLDLTAIDGAIFSGGVAEYLYGRENRSFGDLGLPLGRALAAAIDKGLLPWPLLPATECIRATALGASSFSVQLSGRTGCITNPASLLPRRNLPVLSIETPPDDAFEPEAVAQTVRQALELHDLKSEGIESFPVVLAVRWSGDPDHARLRALAEGVKRGFSRHLDGGLPLYVIADGDIAASLGALLRDELSISSDLLILDGIALSDLDYVDLGRLRLPSGTVPVTIKTLVFRDEPGQKPLRKSPHPLPSSRRR